MSSSALGRNSLTDRGNATGSKAPISPVGVSLGAFSKIWTLLSCFDALLRPGWKATSQTELWIVIATDLRSADRVLFGANARRRCLSEDDSDTSQQGQMAGAVMRFALNRWLTLVTVFGI
jgi:hypothetical protein